MSQNTAVRVLLIDDSPFVRKVLRTALSCHADISVVGEAADPYEAKDLINRLTPDVLVLDLEMPRMDGITFLSILMQQKPMPVIVCSGAAASGSATALRALELGAVEVISKPAGGTAAMMRLGDELGLKIRAASLARRVPHRRSECTPAVGATFASAGLNPEDFIIAVGASTGGTEALMNLFSRVPRDWPATVIVQHMPEGFTGPFSQRLNQGSPMEVVESAEGLVLETGRAILAKGGVHTVVKSAGGSLKTAFAGTDPVHHCCPSVDVLFESVAPVKRRRLIGIILTGMGVDGAAGLLAMRNAGAATIGQNAESCVVYGMPRAAAEIGAVQFTGSPETIPSLVIKAARSLVAERPKAAMSR